MSSSNSRSKKRKKTSASSSGTPPKSNGVSAAPQVSASPPVTETTSQSSTIAPSVAVASKPIVTPIVPVASAPRPSIQKQTPASKSQVAEVAPLTQTEPEVAPPSDRYWLAATGLMILAIVLRQIQLGPAPFHPDESIHAFFSYGFDNYHYDPVYHGPLLYHLVSLFFKLFGQYDYVARLVPSLLGIGLIALILGPSRRWMGNRGALVAAGMVAVSPSVVTYSRHLLHDALALDLTMGAVLCFVTALHYPTGTKHGARGRYALLGLAACLSLFLATKANFFFVLVVILSFYASWLITGIKKFSLPSSRYWPLALFTFVTAAAIIFPRDNTFSTEEKISQHRIFEVAAVLGCATFLFWVTSRSQGPQEVEGRSRWKGGNDWSIWLFALAWSIWIYWFLFGQGAQIIAQWVSTNQFPSTAWVTGRESAQHAISKMLEYWGGQQREPRLPGRHDYYVVLGILYELPIYLAAIGGIWYATKKRTVFTDFLLWWSFASWTVYALANEKVPWLLVHLVLPLSLLGALWIASLDWRKPAFFVATCAGLLFALRGDVAMIFERAGDHAEPLLYAQTPDAFRDALANALEKTRGDGRDIWMNGERQWPSVWYLRDAKFNPIKGTSGTPIAGTFTPDKYRIFIAQDSDMPLVKNKNEWNIQTVNFLVWPRVSWTGLMPDRFIPWFFSRQTIPKSEEEVGPGNSATSILSGKGEWSHATAIIGYRKE